MQLSDGGGKDEDEATSPVFGFQGLSKSSRYNSPSESLSDASRCTMDFLVHAADLLGCGASKSKSADGSCNGIDLEGAFCSSNNLLDFVSLISYTLSARGGRATINQAFSLGWWLSDEITWLPIKQFEAAFHICTGISKRCRQIPVSLTRGGGFPIQNILGFSPSSEGWNMSSSVNSKFDHGIIVGKSPTIVQISGTLQGESKQSKLTKVKPLQLH